jgi:hypothetical protein
VVTALSIFAVVLAGLFALGANLGILQAADRTDVGQLSAAGDLTTPGTQVVDVYVADPPAGTIPPSGSTPGPVQQFNVDVAGTVALATTAGALRVEQVAPTTGWTWTLSQTRPQQLELTFTDGQRTLLFTGSLAADGTIAGELSEPQAPPSSTAGHDDGESHEYEGGEDDD